MNISNGMDRLGKVVFWVSFIGTYVVASLLYMSAVTPSGFGVALGGLALLSLYYAYSEPAKDKPSSFSCWKAVILMMYNLFMIAVFVEKVTDRNIMYLALLYIMPIVVFHVLRVTGMYILRGFTQKT